MGKGESGLRFAKEGTQESCKKISGPVRAQVSWEKHLRYFIVEIRDEETEWGVTMSQASKSTLVEVSRPTYRLINLKLVRAGEIFNIVSAYAPQREETDQIKEEFFDRLGRSETILVIFEKCRDKKAKARGKEKGRQS